MEGSAMGFTDAIKTGFQKYIGFSGRAARSEYWYWVLFVILVQIVAWLIDMTLFGFNTTGVNPIGALASLALFLPGLAVSIRRLHDIDRVGWWIFLALIPIVGAIVLIYWACLRGTVGANRFGPDPLEGKV
jgi:uncharacterized membrane protein YhaH (DUF805 family)